MGPIRFDEDDVRTEIRAAARPGVTATRTFDADNEVVSIAPQAQDEDDERPETD